MFGYVRPPLSLLPQEEQDRFRRLYCGLCHTLRDRCGTAARFILNYDFTYLAMLLTSPEETEPQLRRCVVSPAKKRPSLPADKAMELAADESVILAYWQLRDGVADHDWFRGLKYQALSQALEPAYRRAANNCPAFDETVRRQLALLSRLEREGCTSLDEPADAFAALLAGAAAVVEEPVRRRVLEQLLYHLGRWIYLIDAADDLKKDLQTGNYNPVALRFGITAPAGEGESLWRAEDRQGFALTLDHSIHMMTTAYELWDFGVWSPILEATLYTGLFQVGKAVLDGTYHASRWRSEDRKKCKKVEEST